MQSSAQIIDFEIERGLRSLSNKEIANLQAFCTSGMLESLEDYVKEAIEKEYRRRVRLSIRNILHGN